MKKTEKGNYGYIKYEKAKRTLITAIMFAIPLIIFFTGLQQTGTRKNLFTLVAILGILPAAKVAVGWIMMMMQKSGDKNAVEETEKRVGELTRAYELVVSAYEGTMPLDALVICGDQVVCYSSHGQKDKFEFMEKHMAKILNANRYYSTKVKIFSELKPYMDRVERLAHAPEKYREGIKFIPDENYPELSREELMKRVLMAISL